MSQQSGWTFFGILMALILGHGIHWFVGGAAQVHSPGRNAAVIAQIVATGGLLLYAAYRRHKATRQSTGRGRSA